MRLSRAWLERVARGLLSLWHHGAAASILRRRYFWGVVGFSFLLALVLRLQSAEGVAAKESS
jgi:hypothetical protein